MRFKEIIKLTQGDDDFIQFTFHKGDEKVSTNNERLRLGYGDEVIKKMLAIPALAESRVNSWRAFGIYDVHVCICFDLEVDANVDMEALVQKLLKCPA